jgi:hypothetical protein
MIHKTIAVAAILAMIGWDTSAFALNGFEVTYVTGTVQGANQGIAGVLENTAANELHFQGNASEFSIPYTKIRSYQYREETRFHLGVLPAIAVGMVKARSKIHTVSIAWQGERGVSEVVTLQMSKHTAEGLMTLLRARAERACQPAWAKSCSANF